MLCVRLLHIINDKYDFQRHSLLKCNFTSVKIHSFVLQNYTWMWRLGETQKCVSFCQVTLI